MHLGTAAIVFALFVALYLVVLWFERQTRRSQPINPHPYHNVYDAARGAFRGGPPDHLEARRAIRHERGTR
jgi:hypothetical protein